MNRLKVEEKCLYDIILYYWFLGLLGNSLGRGTRINTETTNDPPTPGTITPPTFYYKSRTLHHVLGRQLLCSNTNVLKDACLLISTTPLMMHSRIPMMLLLLAHSHPLPLLGIHIKRPLHNTRSPRRFTQISNSLRIGKYLVDLLQRFSSRLRRHKEDMDEHRRAEDTKQNIHLPLNILKGRRHEIP